MAVHPAITPQLPNEPCIHGLSDKNWCAICREQNGDKHARVINRAFTPKNPKNNHSSKSKVKTIH